MSEQPNPAVTADLGNNGGPVSFLTPAEAESWIAAEKTHWAWLMQAKQAEPAMADVHGHFNTTWNRLTKVVAQWKNASTDADRDAAKKNLANELSTRYRDPKQAVHSSSPDAKFLDGLRATDPVLAGYTAAWFVSNLVPSFNSPKGMLGGVEAYQYRKGFQGSLDSERGALEQLRHGWQQEWNQAKTKTAEHLASIQALSELFASTKTEQASKFEELMAAHKKSLEDQFNHSKDELAKVAKTYDEFMALQAPVTYWQSRRTRSFAVAAVAILLFVVSAGGSVYFAKGLIGGISANGGIDWAHLGFVIFVLTMVFWWTRILVRLFLSNFHLATDAAERAVLIKTYLAMIREEKAVGGVSRDSMLASVFRPSSSGLIKDDALPHFFYEVLTRVGKP